MTKDKPRGYTLDHIQFSGGNHEIPTATVRLIGSAGEAADTSTGNSPVDAVRKAIDRVIGFPTMPKVESESGNYDGSEATAAIRIKKGGRTYDGQDVSVDIVMASANAYLKAINCMLADEIEPLHDTPLEREWREGKFGVDL